VLSGRPDHRAKVEIADRYGALLYFPDCLGLADVALAIGKEASKA
jgi:hypothetical protein